MARPDDTAVLADTSVWTGLPVRPDWCRLFDAATGWNGRQFRRRVPLALGTDGRSSIALGTHYATRRQQCERCRAGLATDRLALFSRSESRWQSPWRVDHNRLGGQSPERTVATPDWSGLVIVRGRRPARLHPGTTWRAGTCRLLRSKNRCRSLVSQ